VSRLGFIDDGEPSGELDLLVHVLDQLPARSAPTCASARRPCRRSARRRSVRGRVPEHAGSEGGPLPCALEATAPAGLFDISPTGNRKVSADVDLPSSERTISSTLGELLRDVTLTMHRPMRPHAAWPTTTGPPSSTTSARSTAHCRCCPHHHAGARCEPAEGGVPVACASPATASTGTLALVPDTAGPTSAPAPASTTRARPGRLAADSVGRHVRADLLGPPHPADVADLQVRCIAACLITQVHTCIDAVHVRESAMPVAGPPLRGTAADRVTRSSGELGGSPESYSRGRGS
jgi:hypothetical protein